METSQSLLDRLADNPKDQDAWGRLDALYRPFIRSWALRDPALQGDVDDLVQEVMVVLVRELPHFQRRRPGSFRRWLREILVHRIQVIWHARKNRPHQADDSVLLTLADPHSALSRQWDEEHHRHVVQRLLELIAQDFAPTTWQAFQRLVLDRAPTAQVAGELGLSVNAVLLAKSRVLKRLRDEGRDFFA